MTFVPTLFIFMFELLKCVSLFWMKPVFDHGRLDEELVPFSIGWPIYASICSSTSEFIIHSSNLIPSFMDFLCLPLSQNQHPVSLWSPLLWEVQPPSAPPCSYMPVFKHSNQVLEISNCQDWPIQWTYATSTFNWSKEESPWVLLEGWALIAIKFHASTC